MFSKAREIAVGDVVIVWFKRDSCKAITISDIPWLEINGNFGIYRHADLIGKPYGSKIGSRNNKGFIHVLRPTPELWTLALPHRTQILYVADIAFVTSWLGVRPGSVVIEAGTGSGSFSHSVARTIGPKGHLHSFEFHETRCETARVEFKEHGMSEYVTLKHRNVCKSGFELDNVADAVFLDLPAPWEAIPSAKIALKRTQSTRICCFSPCIEQVLRTVTALNDSGFTQITTYETLLRTMDISTTMKGKQVEVAMERLREQGVKREERRVRQIVLASQRKAGQVILEGGGAGVAGAEKRKADEIVEVDSSDSEEDDDEDEDDEGGEEEPAAKKAKLEGELQKEPRKPKIRPDTKVTLSKPFAEQRGHTSYLTFAVLLPTIYPGSQPTPTPEKKGENVADAIELE